MVSLNDAKCTKTQAGVCRSATAPRGILVFSFVLLLPALTHADQYTGMQDDDDAKGMVQLRQMPGTETIAFLPLPSWAHIKAMSPMPDVLSPNGKKVVVQVTPPAPAPHQPLAPPKEEETASSEISAEAAAAKSVPTPAIPPASDNALIAVSPFLEWVRANPATAAAQARAAAGNYQAQTTPAPAAGSTGSSAPAPAGAPAPYWLPPMLDTTAAPILYSNQTPGSSAAIYSTPQR